jgi:uncharacterized protein YbaP (TraB family)
MATKHTPLRRLSTYRWLLSWLLALCLVAPCLSACKGEATPGAARSASASASSSAAPAAQASASAGSANAGGSAAPQLPAMTARPLMWEVEGKGGTSYLFGTMHIGADIDRELHPVVWARLLSSRIVILEADVKAAPMMEMAQAAMLPPDKSLDKMVPTAMWPKVVEASGGMLPEPMLKRMKPWFVMSAITQQMAPKSQPMDLVMQERAQQSGKEMRYLETWKQQVDLLDEAMGVDVLVDALGELDEMSKNLDDLRRAYLRGDAAAIEKLTFDAEEMKEHPKFYLKMFDLRNAAWMAPLRRAFDEGGVFVAVGAGHLLGKRGLVQLFRDEKRKVTRISAGVAAPRLAPPAPSAAAPSAGAPASAAP